MKLLLLFFITLTSFAINPVKEERMQTLKIENYSETGHTQFKKLVPSKNTFKCELLKNIDSKYVEDELDKLPRKFFGTNEKTFYKYFPAYYESDTIFSRSNKTNEAYVFTYNLETVNYKDVSVSISGNLSIKDVFKGKSNDLTATGSLTAERETEEYIKTTESGKMNVVIQPGKKLTLKIVGSAMVTNGISKKYFFGICIKKGAFEVVDITSAVYELVEENA